jgi:hypothetical protein
MRGSTAGPVRDLREIAADIQDLLHDVEAGDHEPLAHLLRLALAEAERCTRDASSTI